MRDEVKGSFVGAGMNRERHPSQMGETEYDFALNASIGSEQGDVLIMQNEGSNIRCSELLGMKVCGYRPDSSAGLTYYFLSDEVTGTSKIVSLRSRTETDGEGDAEIKCGCDFRKVLETGLELSEDKYVPICDEVEVILEDCVYDYDGSSGSCLGFDVRTPIYDIIIKDEKCGRRMYWSQKGRPARYMDFAKAGDRESEYYYKRKAQCGDETVGERTCLNCDKLRVFALMNVPCIEISSVMNGGNLRSGIYEFLIAYCDGSGVETSSYHSLTNPVPIFDESNVMVEGNDYGRQTALGIRLSIKGLDASATFYKIAVIQSADVNNETICYTEGIHSITETDVTLSSSALPGNYREGDTVGIYQMTTLAHLASEKTIYKTTEGLATSGKMLFQYGLEAEPEWNLQPVVNLLGSLFKWQTAIAKESFYKDGKNASERKGYMRDEVYPFGIRFVTDTGYRTAVFPMIGRPSSPDETEDVSGSASADIRSILENGKTCTDTERKYRWQFYNTAKTLGLLEIEDVLPTTTTTTVKPSPTTTTTTTTAEPTTTIDYSGDGGDEGGGSNNGEGGGSSDNGGEGGGEDEGNSGGISNGDEEGTDTRSAEAPIGSECPELTCANQVDVTEERSCEGEYYKLENPEEEWVEIGIDRTFTNLEEYINENKEAICGQRNKHPLLQKICEALYNTIQTPDTGLTELFCDPSTLFPCVCKAPYTLNRDHIEIWIKGITGENSKTIYRTFTSPSDNEYDESGILAAGGNGAKISDVPVSAADIVFNGFTIPESDITECDSCRSYEQSIIMNRLFQFKILFAEYLSGFENSGTSMLSAVEIPKYDGSDFRKYTAFRRIAHKGQTFENEARKYRKWRAFHADKELRPMALYWVSGILKFLDDTTDVPAYFIGDNRL